MKKSYWIWNWGEYEIFHIMNVNLGREEMGYHRPAFWKLTMPYATARFRREIDGDGGYVICHINGSGNIQIDGKRHPAGERIELTPGFHDIEVYVSNPGGLPAIFVESDVCPSDGMWLCDHFAGKFTPVGYNEHFDSPYMNPEKFPFAYERKTPISSEQTDGGRLYDFGREMFGILRISGADPDVQISVYYGESKEEAVDTQFTQITDKLIGKSEYALKPRAFRYIYLTPDNGLEVSADYEYLPLDHIGKFNCDNKLFDDIYSTSAYTFHLNAREGFLDGIKRDRWVWAGDAYQSARINKYLFADEEIEQRTLIGLVGKEPIEQHINTIIDYSLLWMISLHEHYVFYGNKDFLCRIYPMAQKLMDFCETRINADGFIEQRDRDWTFIDWSDIDKTGAVAAEQMLLIRAYYAMAYIMSVLGLDGERYSTKSRELTARVNQYYWNKEKGAFIDSYASGRNNVTRHANIFAVIYDIATDEQKESILRNVLKNDKITKITTPYFEGYELDALCKLGQLDEVERMLSSYWGGMIRLGATTIWEEFDPSMSGTEHYAMYGGKYEKSLCHAWGAGPIYLLGRYYLGVYPTSDGCKTFRVEPRLGGLKEFHGTAPINGGSVTVDMNREQVTVIATRAGGVLVLDGKEYTLPANTPITVK